MERSSQGNGIWVAYIEGLQEGDIYKYAITTREGRILKSDPYAFWSEVRPNTASKLTKLHYTWRDKKWMESREAYDSYRKPMLTYEVHLGSWRRGEDGGMLTYRDIAEELVAYVKTCITPISSSCRCANIPLMVPGATRERAISSDQPLLQARRLHVSHRPLPSERHRCHPRLGTGPLLPRRPRPAPLRRRTVLRIGQSDPGRK